MASAGVPAPALAPSTRIEAAFEELRSKHRILVEESCACCCTCGHVRCKAQLASQPEAIGYAFFHAQDLDMVVEDGELYLGHAARHSTLDRIVPLVTRSVLEDHGFQVDWSGCPAVRLRVPIPQGPDRAYFQRMLAEQWAEYEDEEDYDDDGDGEYDDDEDEEEEGEADGHADGGDGEAQASEGGAAAAPGAVG